MKKAIFLAVGVTAVLALGGFTMRTVEHTPQFVGENDTQISVTSPETKAIRQNAEMTFEGEEKQPEIGDIIYVNGIAEKIFAVAEDGSFITLPE